MKKPAKLLQDLAGKSRYKITKEEWYKYLLDLRQEVDHWIQMTKKDLTNSK